MILFKPNVFLQENNGPTSYGNTVAQIILPTEKQLNETVPALIFFLPLFFIPGCAGNRAVAGEAIPNCAGA